MNNTLQLSGLEKASVLILSLGLKQSARVFEHLTEEEREILGAQMIKLKHVDTVTKQRVLEEVSEIVRLKPTVQPTAPSPVPSFTVATDDVEPADSGAPFKWIETMDPKDAASMLSSERAHNIALVIARLAPKYAAEIIANFSEKTRNEVVHKLAYVRSVSDEVIEAIDQTLRKRADKQSGHSGRDRYTPSTLLESLGNAIKPAQSTPKMFSFPDDLLNLDDTQIQTVLSEVSHTDLCNVLRVAGEELLAAVMRNLDDDIKAAVEQEMSTAGQVKLKELEAAQRRIVDAMKRCVDGSPVVTG